MNEAGESPYETATYVSDYQYGSILFNREFAYITTFEYRLPIDKTFIMLTTRIGDKTEDNNNNIQNSLQSFLL